MCKRLLFLVSLILLLVLGSNSMAQLDPAVIETGHVYLLEDISGTEVPDDSANDNTGNIVGDPEIVTGIRGNALQFDGIDDGVSIPDSDFINVNAGPFPNRTIVAMFKCDDVDKPGKQTVFEEGGTTRGLTIYVSEGLAYGAAWNRAEYNWDGAWLSYPIQSGIWYGVAIVIRDGTEAVEDDKFEMWVNGQLIATAPGGQMHNHGNDNAIGYTLQNNVFHDGNASPADGHYFEGAIDEVWILNEALTAAELGGFAGKVWPFAISPTPKDGSMIFDTWTSLIWRPGGFAVSHDIYIGDNFDDVNGGAESTFKGNQATTEFVVGFPGFAIPEGLEPGVTYYWRIDEVNEAEPNSPWKGEIWSFSIPPRTAYNPVPADGAKFIATDASLSWTEGFGAILHNAYFGDNFDDVNNAVGALPLGDITFDPGPLEMDKTYYWRVDEFVPPTTHKGTIWSFTTAREGGGVKADYFTGMDLTNLVLTRVDPQIDFNWGNPGSPDPSVGDDQFSARWTGEVEAAFTETYTFYTNSDDGVRLWIDGQQLVNNWTNHAATENKGSIDLEAGNTYSLVMEYYEDGGGAVAELRWSSPRTPKDLIPQAALSLPVKAGAPSPANRAVDVSQTSILTWIPGEEANSHEVYFGTDADAVKNADTSSPEYQGSSQLGSESYDPGKLEWGVTFYWRVDEIEADGTVRTGNVWSFTTANFLIVDDMESYNDLDPADPASNRIFLAWVDGFDNPATNGSIVGYANPPFAEQSNVHSGNQSMPFAYDNAVGKSEATLTLTSTRDWTENGVDTLAIWYRGSLSNAPETMYVILNGSAGLDNPNPNAAQDTAWTEWRIGLQAFADQGVNLSNVSSITLGFGNRLNPTAGGAGSVFFDDLRLYAPVQ